MEPVGQGDAVVAQLPGGHEFVGDDGVVIIIIFEEPEICFRASGQMVQIDGTDRSGSEICDGTAGRACAASFLRSVGIGIVPSRAGCGTAPRAKASKPSPATC